MPSDEEYRKQVNFINHKELFELVKRDAAREERSLSMVIVRAVAQAYEQRRLEAELFTQKQPGGQMGGALVFETPTPDQLASERAAKIRASHGQEKS